MHVKKIFALAVVLLNLTLAIYAYNFPKKPLTVALANGTISPSIESCDSTGNGADEFNIGDRVYVKGSGLEPGGIYYIYIVRDYSPWTPYGTDISDLYIVEGPIIVDVAADGSIENQPVLIWDSVSPGYYDIWADSQTDGEIDVYDECDAIDDLDVNNTGFFVVTEMFIMAVPLLFAYLLTVCIYKKKKHCSQKGKPQNNLNHTSRL